MTPGQREGGHGQGDAAPSATRGGTGRRRRKRPARRGTRSTRGARGRSHRHRQHHDQRQADELRGHVHVAEQRRRPLARGERRRQRQPRRLREAERDRGRRGHAGPRRPGPRAPAVAREVPRRAQGEHRAGGAVARRRPVPRPAPPRKTLHDREKRERRHRPRVARGRTPATPRCRDAGLRAAATPPRPRARGTTSPSCTGRRTPPTRRGGRRGRRGRRSRPRPAPVRPSRHRGAPSGYANARGDQPRSRRAGASSTTRSRSMRSTMAAGRRPVAGQEGGGAEGEPQQRGGHGDHARAPGGAAHLGHHRAIAEDGAAAHVVRAPVRRRADRARSRTARRGRRRGRAGAGRRPSRRRHEPAAGARSAAIDGQVLVPASAVDERRAGRASTPRRDARTPSASRSSRFREPARHLPARAASAESRPW